MSFRVQWTLPALQREPCRESGNREADVQTIFFCQGLVSVGTCYCHIRGAVILLNYLSIKETIEMKTTGFLNPEN